MPDYPAAPIGLPPEHHADGFLIVEAAGLDKYQPRHGYLMNPGTITIQSDFRSYGNAAYYGDR